MMTPTQKRLYEVASYFSANLDFFNKNNCFFKAGTDEAMLVAKYKMLDKARDPYLLDITYKITEEDGNTKVVIEAKNKTGKYERTQKTIHMDNVVNSIQQLIRDTVDTVEATMQKVTRDGFYIQDRDTIKIFTNHRHDIINFAYGNNLIIGIDEKLHVNEGVNIVFKDAKTGGMYHYIIKPDGSIFNTQTRQNIGVYTIATLVNAFKHDWNTK